MPVYSGGPCTPAPIDNRWNKKLEFVYSLVTQIRAAIRWGGSAVLLLLSTRCALPSPPSLQVVVVVVPPTRTFHSSSTLPRHRYQHHRDSRVSTDIDGREPTTPTPTTRWCNVNPAVVRPRKRNTTTCRLLPSTCRLVPTLFPLRRSSLFPRFVLSDELAHPSPECICQTLKQIGRQRTNTSASTLTPTT